MQYSEYAIAQFKTSMWASFRHRAVSLARIILDDMFSAQERTENIMNVGRGPQPIY
jgi:hypothetical protein